MCQLFMLAFRNFINYFVFDLWCEAEFSLIRILVRHFEQLDITTALHFSATVMHNLAILVDRYL